MLRDNLEGWDGGGWVERGFKRERICVHITAGSLCCTAESNT